MSSRYPYPPNGLWEHPRQQPEPWPPPEPFNAQGENRNPAGTLPFPSPSKMPLGIWNGIPTQMQWANDISPDYFRFAAWQSPVFDLRPEYRDARGANDTSNSIPIWKPSATNPGAGGKLWVQIGPMAQIAPVSLTSMEIFYEEFGHIQDGNNLKKICPEADISDQYLPGQEDCILGFWPPGDGYPIRFWSVRVIIKYRDATMPSDPIFTIQGSYY